MSIARDPVVRPATTKPLKSRGRPAPGEPFDPNELSRRLCVVIAEQKANAERKRRAKADIIERKEAGVADGRGEQEKTAIQSTVRRESETQTAAVQDKAAMEKWASQSQGASVEPKRSKTSRLRRHSKADLAEETEKPTKPSSAPYVPREAAAQFARTTTPASMLEGKLAHKMSKQALKIHLKDLGADRSQATSSFQRTNSLRRAPTQRDRAHDRSHLRHSRILEEAVELEAENDVIGKRHTFEGALSGRKKMEHAHHQARRSSTGDLGEMVDREDGFHQMVVVMDPAGVAADDAVDPKTADEHRVDWTQSDEPCEKPAHHHNLRPRMSMWTLRGRLGSLTKHSRDEKTPAVQGTEASLSPTSPKSPKVGFFSRFKH